MDERAARYFYSDHAIVLFTVPDSREGWASAIEQMELYAYKQMTDLVLLLDFSGVRPYGTPIKGMQNRPSSGPGPLMEAIERVAHLRGMRMPRWRQALIADLFAECVLVGGARRSARIAVKYWKNTTILDFIDVKRPIEYHDKTIEEVKAIGPKESWSANNSVVAVNQRPNFRVDRQVLVSRWSLRNMPGALSMRERHRRMRLPLLMKA